MLNGVITGKHYKDGIPIQVHFESGVITEIQPYLSPNNVDMPWIAPGLVDLQVNGFYGIDLNTLPLQKEELKQLIRKLWSVGVTSFYPTIITNDTDRISELLSVFAQARKGETIEKEFADTIGGFHLEGPFISPEDGPRGAHAKEYIIAPCLEKLKEWYSKSEKGIKILTLSPEWNESVRMIRWCVEHDIIVSIGHTSATGMQINDAVKAGASMSTHLGNGAHPILPRHPNYIWEQLAQDNLFVCAIADGFHVPFTTLKVFYKVKKEKMLLVSDTVSLAGMPVGRYQTHVGDQVSLIEEGKLHMISDPRLLAGSVMPLIRGIENMVNYGICSWSEAWEMASVHPANKMNLPTFNGISLGAPADMVLYKVNQRQINVIRTIKNGRTVYETHYK